LSTEPKGIRRLAWTAAQRALLIEAGDALARWLQEQGLSAQDLEEAARDQVDLLSEALRSIPTREVEPYRHRLSGVVESLRDEQWTLLLQQVASNPGMSEHAQVLYRHYWDYTAPCLRRAKQWFLGNPGLG
jgi:hypothetical protein